jgi:hypothetical protein
MAASISKVLLAKVRLEKLIEILKIATDEKVLYKKNKPND